MVAKNKRIVDPKAIEWVRSRAKNHEGYFVCEYCRRWVRSGEVHHIKTKGSGGDDVDGNLIFLCTYDGSGRDCHRLAHNGKIDKERLYRIAADRTKEERAECNTFHS
jgi:HNH endonuclease.